jgi:hypothetical protein
MYFKDQVMDINRNNCETFFLLYLDRELNAGEMQSVENFLNENTDLQKEFRLLQQTVFTPPETIFDQKESLFREEEKRRIVPLYWMRVAASVTLLIMAGWLTGRFLKNNRNETGNSHALISKETKKNDSRLNPPVESIVKNNGGGKTETQVTKENNGFRNRKTAHSGQGKPENITVAYNRKITNEENKNPAAVDVTEEIVPVKKSGAGLEASSVALGTGSEMKQVSGFHDIQGPAVLAVPAASKTTISHDETDQQSDNAISVIALDDRNKAITGFFKKLTKRAPADKNTRKVSVSVFQFSY